MGHSRDCKCPGRKPFIQLEMLTEDGPLNYKEENGPKALKVPFSLSPTGSLPRPIHGAI